MPMSMASSSSTQANLLGKRKEADVLETRQFLRKHKETKTTTTTTRSISPSALPKKTLFVDNISPETFISDIIDFFKDVGQVVFVRICTTRMSELMPYGFVEFASANQANKALREKNGEYLHGYKISLAVATFIDQELFSFDHKVWCEEDYQYHQSKEEEDVSLTPPRFVEKVLFVANLSPKIKKVSFITKFFLKVINIRVAKVRLVVNREGNHVGYGFVEFFRAEHADMALEEKNGEYLLDRPIFLMRVPHRAPNPVEEVDVRNKTLYVSRLSHKTDISDIINFFKDVGQVVHVRRFVNLKGKVRNNGLVEFASADEANKALEKKNGEYLHEREVFLDVFDQARYLWAPKWHCIDHKVWYENYIGQEKLVTKVEQVLDETSDFVEEVAVREKTVFFASKMYLSDGVKYVLRFFRRVGSVVRARLIVDRWGKYVGSSYVEFASADEAKKVVEQEKEDRYIIHLAMDESDPYPNGPKYDHAVAEKLWYEDNLRQESLCLKKEEKVVIPVVFLGKKTIFSYED